MDKVISSNITRSFNKKNDELYELLKVVPAKPIVVKPVKSNTCEFQPRNDKQYVPKKKIRHKVRTVRDIRHLYEQDIMSELPAELEKQQNYILRKIKGTSLREDKTKSVAKSLINSDKPLTKSSWQMLMNINPEGNAHALQYVLSNGKPIRVNGSRGGKNKFIFKYDLERKESLKKLPIFKKKITNKKKGSLLNSLSVNFKPGPLARKEFLDNSYQKYHVGHIEVINLPKPALEVQPSYGTALDPTISCFINKLRDENGTITQKWAEFAVSVLGNVPKTKEIDQNNSVTFDLSYKHNQTRLLMRRDIENDCNVNKVEGGNKFIENEIEDDLGVIPELRVMMDQLLDAVEITICQDDMCKEDDEVREQCQIDQQPSNCKDKLKRKYGELDRLAVTVIRLNENDSSLADPYTCKNSYCALGCICNSLKSTVTLKGHCGRIECMFECRCEFSEYSMIDAMDNNCPDLLPGLFNLNNEINCTLAKEEQKFHQTVIVSGDKSILLKSKKRNCKSTKRYEDYYSSLSVKPKSKVKPILTIIEPKLNCENIEPWCMVHNLYKCFCKGRFTEMTVDSIWNDVNKKVVGASISDAIDLTEIREEKYKDKESYAQKSYQTRPRREKNNDRQYQDFKQIDSNVVTDSCARLRPYFKRKYSDNYYTNANNKIQEMEMNDSKLRKRLKSLVIGNDNVINTEEMAETSSIAVVLSDPTASLSVSNPKTSILSSNPSSVHSKSKITMIDESCPENSISNRPKLVAWLESSYQQYKRRLDMGTLKNILEAPKKGKVALYPWDFLLNRYSEKKNLFLVSKQAPFRIFMAVNANNPLFKNCINIDDIRFAELNKYPSTVKNLLKNTNTMKDYFCILYGYNHCWEFVGAVTKVSDHKERDLVVETPKTVQDEHEPIDDECSKLFLDLDPEEPITISTAIQESPHLENLPKKSRWFIMTVEKDFSEIQFYNRGFFVKYDSIVNAINVARVSGKTVRLSSQRCADDTKPDDTQFGLHAIPNTNEYCVFIGPYEVNESLGIETIKTISDVRKSKRTRGIWITTDKVDNVKVIDNPLSFIPTQPSEYKDLLSIENSDKEVGSSINDDIQSKKDTQIGQDNIENQLAKELPKVIKPIRISKSNGFYHLSSKSLLKNVLKSPIKQQKFVPIKPKSVFLQPTTTNTTNLTDVATPIIFSCTEEQPVVTSLIPMTCAGGAIVNRLQNRPIAEVAPQIKIAAVYSECDRNKIIPRKRKEGGMFILKPEEINQRLGIDDNKSPKAGTSASVDEEHETAMDIEHFLDNSTICPAPENEAFVISDDEDGGTSPPLKKEDNEIKEIYLECVNIENLGVLKGEMHNTKGVRFEFPGFKISEYYEPEEVFLKINQVLSRRVYIPKDLVLEWRIVDSFSKLETQELLTKDSFGTNLIMTKQGIKKKTSVHGVSLYRNVKTYLKKKDKVDTKSEKKESESAINNEVKDTLREFEKKGYSSEEFEKDSLLLEEESNELFSETVSNKEDIIKTILTASDIKREALTNVLKDIEILSNIED